jgi:uncharacterized Tic20 family protein
LASSSIFVTSAAPASNSVEPWKYHRRHLRRSRPPPFTPSRTCVLGARSSTPAPCSACSCISPLILWLIKRDESPELDAHGKEAVNFQISILIYNAIAAVFCLILVGFVFLFLLWILNTIFVIIAAIQASDGKFFRYPIKIRFVQ